MTITGGQLELLGVWLIAAGATGYLAHVREDPQPGLWLIFGLLLGPLAFIAAFLRASADRDPV